MRLAIIKEAKVQISHTHHVTSHAIGLSNLKLNHVNSMSLLNGHDHMVNKIITDFTSKSPIAV